VIGGSVSGGGLSTMGYKARPAVVPSADIVSTEDSAGTPKERAASRADRHFPTDLAYPCFEARRLKRKLHEPVDAAVIESSFDDDGLLSVNQLVGLLQTVFYEQDRSTGHRAVSYERPEGVKALQARGRRSRK
jgi:hypothetical protein